jgi:uncharacterized membrane protein
MMTISKYLIILVSIITAFTIYCCVPEKITLHGDIKGSVTDAETSEPI